MGKVAGKHRRHGEREKRFVVFAEAALLDEAIRPNFPDVASRDIWVYSVLLDALNHPIESIKQVASIKKKWIFLSPSKPIQASKRILSAAQRAILGKKKKTNGAWGLLSNSRKEKNN